MSALKEKLVRWDPLVGYSLCYLQYQRYSNSYTKKVNQSFHDSKMCSLTVNSLTKKGNRLLVLF